MRKASENKGNSGALSEYFSPRSKVKDLLQQHPQSPYSSFVQETPMKPSQVPNRLSNPPPRRALPLPSPELCHRNRQHLSMPPCYPPQPPGSNHSSGFVQYSQTHVGSPANKYKYQASPLHRVGTLQHFTQQPRPICPSGPVAGSPMYNAAPANRSYPTPSSNFQHAYCSPRQEINNHSPSSHIRRDQVTKSAVTLSSSGSRNPTDQRHDSAKVQSSEIGCVPMVQLHRPSVLPLSSQPAKEVIPPHASDSWSLSQTSLSSPSSDWSRGSSLSIMHSPVTPGQDQQHEQTPSKEKPLAENLNHSYQKRHREPDFQDDNAKKPCLQSFNSDRTPKSTVGTPLSPSSASQSSLRHSLYLELSPKTTENHLSTEPTSGKSLCLKLSPSLKSTCTSPAPQPCLNTQPSFGAKHASGKSSNKNTVMLRSPGEDSWTKRDDASTLSSSKVQHKDNVHLDHHNTAGTPVVPVQSSSRVNQAGESRKPDLNTPKSDQKQSSSSSSCRKNPRSRRSAIPNDIDELFTPDPMTYIVNSGHKTVKPRADGVTKSHTSEKSCSSTIVTSSTSPLTGSLCNQSPTSPHPQTKVSSSDHMEISMPTVTLVRVQLENLPLSSKDSPHSSPVSSSERHIKDELSKNKEKHKSITPKNVTPCTVEKDAASSKQTSPSPCSLAAPRRDGQTGERDAKSINDEESSLELDLGLNFEVDLDLTQSSHSSDDEQLLSLQEMMAHITKPPNTPDKGAFSEPSTPGHTSHKKTQPLVSTSNTSIYKNNLDQMLKDIITNKKAKEIETQLLTACKEDLLRIAEYEEAEENREEAISAEQQQFLQRYSLMSSAIRDVPPGEVVFNLDNFGRIFSQDTLQLRQCMVNPQETTQKTLLWSSHAQLRLHINIGLFQEAYNSRSPCPSQVTRFLFKMMSVHSERILCEKILQALCDIAYTAACQIVKNRSQQFKVWVPSLADVTLVLMNMGVPFVTLYPFENLQPPFTEGDLLEDVYIKSESPSRQKEYSTFPEHNCNNIFKYLSFCTGLCPRAYSDSELLLLLTVLGTIGLDTRLICQSSVELYLLQYKLVNNIRDWDTMMPRICLAFTDLTDDHHNMCLLVQLLPDNMRGKQLRRHLSLSMISKLLDGNCTYRPKNNEFQLSDLRLYLPRMQPSTILRGLMSSSSRTQTEREDMSSLDQQAYYLCYSLLTLANEASNFQFFPACQKEQLLFLSSELETHVKCDIRENEKCLYRSKVKDLVARIYTKWQMLLQRTRPLNGKLYDYWQPLQTDTLTSSQEAQESDTSDDGDDTVIEKDSISEENEKEEEDVEGVTTGEGTRHTGKPEEKETDVTIDEANKTRAAAEPAVQNMTHEMTEMEVCDSSEVTGEQTQAEGVESAEKDTEGGLYPDQVAPADSAL